jgi:hypothetical protein
VQYNASTALPLSLAQTMVIAGSTVQSVEPSLDEPTLTKTYTDTLSTQGTTLTFKRVCPSRSAGTATQMDYSVVGPADDGAGSEQLILYFSDHGTTFGAVFTKK